MIDYVCAACTLVVVFGLTFAAGLAREEARRAHERIDELAIAMRGLVDVVEVLNRKVAEIDYESAKPPFQSTN
jgi:hypothetical protein